MFYLQLIGRSKQRISNGYEVVITSLLQALAALLSALQFKLPWAEHRAKQSLHAKATEKPWKGDQNGAAETLVRRHRHGYNGERGEYRSECPEPTPQATSEEISYSSQLLQTNSYAGRLER